MRLCFKCFLIFWGIIFLGNLFAKNDVGTVIKFDPGKFKIHSKAQFNKIQGPFYFIDAP